MVQKPRLPSAFCPHSIPSGRLVWIGFFVTGKEGSSRAPAGGSRAAVATKRARRGRVRGTSTPAPRAGPARTTPAPRRRNTRAGPRRAPRGRRGGGGTRPTRPCSSRPKVELQYLVEHRTHRGASWASGAAQAAQFVRIILRWFGVFVSSRDGVLVLLVSYTPLANPVSLPGRQSGHGATRWILLYRSRLVQQPFSPSVPRNRGL